MSTEYRLLSYALDDAELNLKFAKKDFEKKLEYKEFDNIKEEYLNLMEMIEAQPTLIESIRKDMLKALRLEISDLGDLYRDSDTFDSSAKINLGFFEFNIAADRCEEAAKSVELISTILGLPNLNNDHKSAIEDLYDYSGVSISVLYPRVFPSLNSSCQHNYMVGAINDLFTNLQQNNGIMGVNYRTEHYVDKILEVYNFDNDMKYMGTLKKAEKEMLSNLKTFLDDYFSKSDVILSEDEHSLPPQIQTIINKVNDISIEKDNELRQEIEKIKAEYEERGHESR